MNLSDLLAWVDAVSVARLFHVDRDRVLNYFWRYGQCDDVSGKTIVSLAHEVAAPRLVPSAILPRPIASVGSLEHGSRTVGQ